MNKQTIMTITRYLLVLTPIIWVAWDIVAFIFGGNPWTESANIAVYSRVYGSVPLSWGLLTGHFFAQNRLPTTQTFGDPFFKNFWCDAVLIADAGWLVWDILAKPGLLTELITKIPGPGNGLMVIVTVGTVLGWKLFQMEDATLPG